MAKTILIIEDDASLTRVLADTLKKGGFEVVIAPNGEEGLESALKGHPDLLLLDLLLPKMSGVSLLEELAKDSWGKTAPVIAITNSSDEKLEKNAYGTGANIVEYLVKANFKLADIVEKVKNAAK